jgi:hypothetical protein
MIAQPAADTCLARAAVVTGSVTSRSQARRDCFAASRAVDRPPIPRPARDGALGGPRDDGVDADLGHQLDRELAAVALGQSLRDGQSRPGRGDRANRSHIQHDPILAD